MIQRLADEVEQGNRIVVSAITYAEMRYGQIGKKASAKHKMLVDKFVKRLDAVLAWDQRAVDATVKVMSELSNAAFYWFCHVPISTVLGLSQISDGPGKNEPLTEGSFASEEDPAEEVPDTE